MALVALIVLLAEASARVPMVCCCIDYCCTNDTRPSAWRPAGVFSIKCNGACSADCAPFGGIGSSADGVLLLRRSDCRALTALLVECSLALLATRLRLRQ